MKQKQLLLFPDVESCENSFSEDFFNANEIVNIIFYHLSVEDVLRGMRKYMKK